MEHILPLPQRRILLDTARTVLEKAANDQQYAGWRGQTPSGLLKKRGIFVSLHKSGKLRGCIGLIEPVKTIIDGVEYAAYSAGFTDPRFPPVMAAEVDSIDIEISVLSTPRHIDSPQQIELGRHGIILNKGEGRALFLPQVATEYKWDIPTTLAHLSMKAGLGPDAWREEAQFEVFEALVFH